MRRGIVPVTAACAVLLPATGCADGGGVRVEGRAASAGPSPSPSVVVGKVDPVALLKQDPRVRDEFKEDVKRCPGGKYPLGVGYGNLTDSSVPDVVINLSTCGDGMGLGTYVYQKKGGTYKNVFLDEQPPVHAGISNGNLKVTRLVYTEGDPVCCPTGERATTYAWNGGWFSEIDYSRSSYGKKSDG